MKARTYDKEFKLNAISLYKSGKGKRRVCRDLGIPESTFFDWVKAYEEKDKKAFVGSGNSVDKNLCAIKKELEDVRLERDILKKALAIFSKQK